MLRKFLFAFTLACLSLTAVFAARDNEKTVRSKRANKKLNIKVVPWGPTQADVDAARQRAAASEVVRRELNGANFREVGFEYLYSTNETKSQASLPPKRFRVTYYNYSTDMTLYAEGDFAGTEPITAHWTNDVPGVGGAEILAAYQVIDQDTQFRGLRESKKAEYSEAMPPTTIIDGERLVNILITDPKTGANQIVGVSFKNNKIVKYPNDAPPAAISAPESCGLANSGQGSLANGVAGQATLTVNDTGGNALWEMLIVRPSASSGRNFERSGLEIRDVKYKGKMVLKRGHVPILNVKYVASCGPYRDWQYSEGFFNAPDAGALNPAPGIRILAPGQVATTAIESRNDTGNYQGVAIYTESTSNGQEVVLVTEMNAGWYRYIMEWRFATDGTIRPRYGFGSVADGCVCIQRTHHVYWRFDFDVVNSANKVFLLDRGRKYRTPIETESAFFKKPQTNRSLLIQNGSGDEAYQLVPGTNDGKVTDDNGNLTDTFGAGDIWIMRFKGTAASPDELDDSDGPEYPGAYLAPWVNGESLVDQDVVVWYAGHQVRQDDSSRPGSPQVISGAHIMGPILRPVLW
jgi:hypothetical protein